MVSGREGRNSNAAIQYAVWKRRPLPTTTDESSYDDGACLLAGPPLTIRLMTPLCRKGDHLTKVSTFVLAFLSLLILAVTPLATR